MAIQRMTNHYEWTREKPTHSGWYLFWDGREDIYPVAIEVLSDASGRCFPHVNSRCHRPGKDFSSDEWSGWWKQIDTSIPDHDESRSSNPAV